MCARYSVAKDLADFAKFFNFVCRVAFFAPRYNIAPRQQAPVIVLDQFQPTLKLMRWGLIPSWAKDESIGEKLINARAETISEKPSFRKPMERQRCLIPADGFYEWQMGGRGSRVESRGAKAQTVTPFRFTMQDNSFFCFAGIYEKWIRPPKSGEFDFGDLDEPPPSRVVETFSIITTTANAMVAAIHDRMPVIVHPDHWLWWIDERRDGEAVKFMLRPYPAEDMDCYRVSKLVNNARNDSPDCIKAAWVMGLNV
jgi:putative SOS response-associated peptidase YedK